LHSGHLLPVKIGSYGWLNGGIWTEEWVWRFFFSNFDLLCPVSYCAGIAQNANSEVEEGSYACGGGVGRRKYVYVARAIVRFLVAVLRYLACVLNAFLSRLKHVGGF